VLASLLRDEIIDLVQFVACEEVIAPWLLRRDAEIPSRLVPPEVTHTNLQCLPSDCLR
jgi:hypothetical protein